MDLSPFQEWTPLPRPFMPPQPVRVRPGSVVWKAGDGAVKFAEEADDQMLVGWRHWAPHARAVALQINGWWHPDPPTGLDMQPSRDGWFHGAWWLPASMCASVAFAEHAGPDEPPWWTLSLKGRPTVGGHIVDMARRTIEESRDTASLPVYQWPGPGPRARWCRVGDESCGPLPLVVFTDAEAHLDRLDTPGLLAGAVRRGEIPPLLAVFVDAGPQRALDLGVPHGQASWIADVLVPQLRRQGLTADDSGEHSVVDPDPRRTVVTGASFGGLTAVFTFLRAPQLCGSVSAQSVSLWRYPSLALAQPLGRAVTATGGVPVRLHAGHWEGRLSADAQALVEAVELEYGHTVPLTVHQGGHDWAWWRHALLDDLAAFLG